MITRHARPVVVALALLAAVALPAVAQERRPTLLAVFAHADDEFVIGPLLARYAREGADVHLLIVTRGEKYAPETGLPPGDEIARVRASEAQCVARTLGINPPILLGFDDGGLGQPVMPPWVTLGDARDQIASRLSQLRPDVVITWGPEGGYGHPDHRLVGALVTEIFQNMKPDDAPLLLYPGMVAGRVPPGENPAGLPWATSPLERLTVQVPYTDADLTVAADSFLCYASQFPESERRAIPRDVHERAWQGQIYLRPWQGSAEGKDIFTLERR